MFCDRHLRTAVAFCHLHTLFSLKSEIYSSYEGSFSASACAVTRQATGDLGDGGGVTLEGKETFPLKPPDPSPSQVPVLTVRISDSPTQG